MTSQKCVIFGLGYIGLPTAVLLANHNISVTGVDINDKVVDSVNAGKMHIIEPGLNVLLKEAVNNGRLKASKSPESADVFIISVPTPFKGEHEPDLSYIKNACSMLAPVLKKGDLIILESTSPVGTTEKIAEWLAQDRPDLTFPQKAGEDADIQLAHCPERVLPGKIIKEIVENDRIIGGMTKKSAQMASDFYKTFVKGKIIQTNARTAEMSKLTENSFRDVNIAFANELSVICDKLDIDVWELISLANLHPRVNILKPGCGVGGHCIAVDPWFIVDANPGEARLIATARKVNDEKPEFVVKKIEESMRELNQAGKSPDKIKIACLGLSYKPDIDDLRESPAIKIVKKLASLYPGQIIFAEPNISKSPKELSRADAAFVSADDTLKADIIVKLVPHTAFSDLKIPENAVFLDFTGSSSSSN